MNDPKPCIFCGNQYLQLKAVVFRHWNVHCDSCGAKGPTGETPDLSIINWNSYHNYSLHQRKILDMSDVDQTKTDKIWKSIRALRTFTVSDVAMITEENRNTVYDYIRLLEKADYLRIEATKDQPGNPNVYRCIKPKEVNAPTWTQLKYKRVQEAMSREKVRHMKPVRMKASAN